MDRYAADRTVKRLSKRAGITKRISPHSLRHSFITAALDASVPRRDVQEAASQADPRTTMRYDRPRQSLDRHATYFVAERPAPHDPTPGRADHTDTARHRMISSGSAPGAKGGVGVIILVRVPTITLSSEGGDPRSWAW